MFDVHVTVHRDMWPCIVTCDRATRHVTVHRDMWPCIVTCDRASRHVTVHRDMWPCIASCDCASWHVTVHRDKFLIIKPTIRTNFSNLFWNETLHVSDSFTVHHQELFAVHSAVLYVIQVCRQLPSSSCYSQAVYKLLWRLPLLSVQWKTPNDGQRNCPKHVAFHFKINLRN
jgi:hypothetical protein